MGFFSSDFDDDVWFERFAKIFVIAFVIIFIFSAVFGIMEELLKLYLGFSLADNFPDLLEAIKSRLLK